MDKVVAKERSGLSKDMILLFWNNRKFWSCEALVHRILVTWTYLQDLIAKRKALVARLTMAFLAGVEKGS
jgi:hypothetical protein